jgi:two-component system response regulator FixJ
MVGRKRASFVAVVEDDVGVRTAVLELLRACDIEARGFSSAEEFLQSRQRFRAACMVLDLRLPGMTGLELLQVLLAGGLKIPAICSTAEADLDERLRRDLLQAGAVAVLRKPFDTGELLGLIDAALGRRVGP